CQAPAAVPPGEPNGLCPVRYPQRARAGPGRSKAGARPSKPAVRRAAEPVVRKELHNLPDESVFIYCLVGDRAYWKDPNNEFRRNLKLTGVPTLLKYGTPQKLVEEECFKAELVRMLFTED
ncbi:thioredoxin domain-containing protein 17, partial [Manacus vitellinus]|uniref:thioredoxin domain-containing protein 17 n=1 Tax=Manacus vitellinus TaxID=328815 RepID=UPI00115E21A3